MYFKLDRAKGHLKLASEVKALLESGADAAVLDIDKHISDAGFTWALDKPTNAAYEIIPTRAAKSACKLLGRLAFSRMLELMAGAWHGSQSSLKSGMIAGMALFLKTYETEIDDYTFVTRLTPLTLPSLPKLILLQTGAACAMPGSFAKSTTPTPAGKSCATASNAGHLPSTPALPRTAPHWRNT